jgi:hypothetical protein
MSAEAAQSALQKISVAEAGVGSGQLTSRDSRLDMLRGLCLVLMTVDHLPINPLFRFTNQTLGFVSAAEGFVFISGVVSGGCLDAHCTDRDQGLRVSGFFVGSAIFI